MSFVQDLLNELQQTGVDVGKLDEKTLGKIIASAANKGAGAEASGMNIAAKTEAEIRLLREKAGLKEAGIASADARTAASAAAAEQAKRIQARVDAASKLVDDAVMEANKGTRGALKRLDEAKAYYMKVGGDADLVEPRIKQAKSVYRLALKGNERQAVAAKNFKLLETKKIPKETVVRLRGSEVPIGELAGSKKAFRMALPAAEAAAGAAAKGSSFFSKIPGGKIGAAGIGLLAIPLLAKMFGGGQEKESEGANLQRMLLAQQMQAANLKNENTESLMSYRDIMGQAKLVDMLKTLQEIQGVTAQPTSGVGLF